jgi:PAS domain S-box-containing protein
MIAGQHLFHPNDYGLIFNAILEHSKDGLFITDQTGRVMLINRAYAEMFDVNVADIIGSSVWDIVNRGVWSPNLFEQVIKSGQTVSIIQTTHRGKNILSTGTPVWDDSGHIRFVLFNDRDISSLDKLIGTLERKELKQDLIRFIFSEDNIKTAEISGFVADSPAMASILKTVVRASKFNIPLILNGETGVGKSKIARLIHDLSDRCAAAFVDINCGAIPEALLESELFGYERGAFTGAATGGKRGLFEIAHGGTLFLDEISELPLPLQVKLFKFIENGEMMRVGGVAPTKVDTRIIAATNRDLKEMMHRGEFRGELYYRLNVVPIHIPPLRERKEDIIALTEMFIELYNEKFNTRKRFSKSVQQELYSYSFPGNVRELENLVKRLVTMAEDDYIRIKHLPEYLDRIYSEDPESEENKSTSYRHKIGAMERRVIQEAVKKYGSQNKAAKELGLNQSTLSRKLRK